MNFAIHKMVKSLEVVDESGAVSLVTICKFSYLLILASLVYISALAVNDFAQAVLARYIKKDGLLGHLAYVLLTIILVLLAVYLGCRCSPDLANYINISPIT